MNVLGVMGGNGVILFPFRQYLLGNIETRALFKTPSNEQWEANFPGVPLITNEKDLSIKNFVNEQRHQKIDIIIGAPDCGDSSVLSYSRRKKLGNPKDNPSLTLYFKMVKKFQPKVWLMENLAALLDTITKEDLAISFPDYNIIYHTKSVSAWGNPQLTRIRLVIIGVRKDQPQNLTDKLNYVKPIYRLKQCRELAEGLVYGEKAHVREDENEVITMYAGYKISIKDIKKEWMTTRAFKKRWEVTGGNFSTAPGVYRNLEDEYPATARKANRQFNHKGEMMSPRELARIQGIPDRFEIIMKEDRLNYYINKGRTTCTKTPPMEIPKWFRQQLRHARFIKHF